MRSAGVANMFSKIPYYPNTSGDQSPDVDREVDNVLLSQSVKDAHVEQEAPVKNDNNESNDNSIEPDIGISAVHMAFLQLMTQKVMEANAKCPDTLKLLNAAICRKPD